MLRSAGLAGRLVAVLLRPPEEVVPFLEQALVSFPGPWLLPDETGAMRNLIEVEAIERT